MTTLTFLGSQISYEPTRITTKIDGTSRLKYRGVPYEPIQAITGEPGMKGLQFRGSRY